MPTAWWENGFDNALWSRCRREVRAAMVAANFQIGGKFEEVLTRRARKLYARKSRGE